MRADATTATHETRCPSESAKVEPGEGCPVTGRKTIYLLGGVSRLNGGSASVIPSRGGFPRHLFRCEGRPVSLNSHQRAYVEYLHAQPLSDLCWCGWYAKDECGSWCSKSGKGLTAADKAKEACAECGNTPWEPGLPVTHNIKCSKNV